MSGAGAIRDGGADRSGPALETRRVTSIYYFEIGMANSAPFPMLSGQRWRIDFCFV
ncbi:hypothetical protein JOE11_004867 [Robbsia andropogonis]